MTNQNEKKIGDLRQLRQYFNDDNDNDNNEISSSNNVCALMSWQRTPLYAHWRLVLYLIQSKL